MSLYHERRFTKLGYSAASILQALPLLQSLLDETWKSNLLVEACKIYLGCEFFLTELQLLAYFTHKITLPFLNCVEKSSQTVLLQMLPKLHLDLLAGNTETLKDFSVAFRHVKVEELTSQLQKDALKMMCVDAAHGIKMQCGREYGFDDDADEVNPRATELYKLNENELKDMPTNNINAERDLAKFSHLAVVAKFRNKNFTAKGIRNDIVLLQSSQSTVDSLTTKIHKVLTDREHYWSIEQKQLQKLRIERKVNEAKKDQDYTTKLLQACKSWGGPCTTANELEVVLSRRNDLSEKIVKTELSYYRKTHQSEKHNVPELFKLTKISHEERLENLFILLSDEKRIASMSSAAILDLPTNEEVSQAINGVSTSQPKNNETITLNQICVVVWAIGKQVEWFIGYVNEKKDVDSYIIEHLHRYVDDQHEYWKHPVVADMQTVSEDQIIPCKVDGEWESTNTTATRIEMRFHLKNASAIDNTFQKLMAL